MQQLEVDNKRLRQSNHELSAKVEELSRGGGMSSSSLDETGPIFGYVAQTNASHNNNNNGNNGGGGGGGGGGHRYNNGYSTSQHQGQSQSQSLQITATTTPGIYQTPGPSLLMPPRNCKCTKAATSFKYCC